VFFQGIFHKYQPFGAAEIGWYFSPKKALIFLKPESSTAPAVRISRATASAARYFTSFLNLSSVMLRRLPFESEIDITIMTAKAPFFGGGAVAFESFSAPGANAVMPSLFIRKGGVLLPPRAAASLAAKFAAFARAVRQSFPAVFADGGCALFGLPQAVPPQVRLYRIFGQAEPRGDFAAAQALPP
jgi:hypothetical protein